MKIKEIIVVEGRDDTAKIKSAVDADTIETNGSAIGEDVIKRIRLAQETRGVIILTDPDFPGKKSEKRLQKKSPAASMHFYPSIWQSLKISAESVLNMLRLRQSANA